jgi:hypothetical protein
MHIKNFKTTETTIKDFVTNATRLKEIKRNKKYEL